MVRQIVFHSFAFFKEGISLPGRNFPVFPGMPPQTALLISQIRPAIWRRFLKLWEDQFFPASPPSTTMESGSVSSPKTGFKVSS